MKTKTGLLNLQENWSPYQLLGKFFALFQPLMNKGIINNQAGKAREILENSIFFT